MRYQTFFFLLWHLLYTAPMAVAADKTIDLLHHPSAVVDYSLSAGVDKSAVAALIDNKPLTTASLQCSSETPVELLYSFDEIVSVEKLHLQRSKKSGKSKMVGELELLVSSLSSTMGFQLLRSAEISDRTSVQRFHFPQTGAKWLLVRVLCNDAQALNLSGLQIFGHPGPPQSNYSFKESPAEALQVLTRLKKSVKVSITPDEESLFEDARDGRFDEWSFAEAALLASGVQDPQQRKRYLEKLDKLEKSAHNATSDYTKPFQKGEALLKWMHHGPLASGYISKQTDLSTLLDTKTYNCVSSATFFNIMARRLGLDARAIEVPDHAFSIVYDGSQHADVETTTLSGFNPSRNRNALQDFVNKTGFSYIPERNRNKRREIGESGLIAVTYYNHGVALTEDKQYYEALIWYFRALSLDPNFKSAVKNVLSVLANWSVQLVEDKKFEQATDVLSLGLELAPADRTLLHNQKFVWHKRVDATIEAGDINGALALLKEAEKTTSDTSFLKMQAWVFIKQGETQIETGNWNQALQIAEQGRAQIEGKAQEELDRWKSGVIIRWSNHALETKDFETAAAVLEEGLKAEKPDWKIRNNIGFIAQEWAEAAYATGGWNQAERVLDNLLKSFPNQAKVKRASTTFIFRRIEALIKAKKFEQARQITERYKHFVGNGRDLAKLATSTYDTQADIYLEKKDYPGAISVYTQALEQRPNDSHLKQNEQAVWDMWAHSLLDSKQWDKALDVYESALKRYPGYHGFEQNVRYTIQEYSDDTARKEGKAAANRILKKLTQRFSEVGGVSKFARQHIRQAIDQLIKQQEFAAALQELEQSRPLLASERDFDGLVVNVYYHWSHYYSDNGDWPSAVSRYDEALSKFAQNRKLKKNAIATWHAWAKEYLDSKEWAKAIEIYEDGLNQIPDASLFKQNIKYCRSKLEKP